MKIKAEKNVLLTALSRIQGIVEKNSIKPITSNALIVACENCLTVSATNLQIALKATYKNIKIEKEGKISVNAKKIFEIVKQLPDKEIEIEEKENYHIYIRSGKALIEIIGLPPEDFPSFVEDETGEYIQWDKNIFLSMLNLTSFSISRDDSKQNIGGAYLEPLEDEKMRMVTTDGYRLSIVDGNLGKKINFEEGITIPAKGVQEINKLLLEKKEEKNIYFFIKKNIFVIKINEIDLLIRLIEKKFPNYKIIIPGEGYNKEKIKLNKNKVRDALRIMCVIANENNRPVYFEFSGNKLSLNTQDGDFGSAQEDITLNDPVKKEIKFCINGAYLLDIINAIEDDFIIEYFEDENKPIVVKKEKETNIKFIIMPMKMD